MQSAGRTSSQCKCIYKRDGQMLSSSGKISTAYCTRQWICCKLCKADKRTAGWSYLKNFPRSVLIAWKQGIFIHRKVWHRRRTVNPLPFSYRVSSMRCQYCHNPDTWQTGIGTPITVDEILRNYSAWTVLYERGGLTVTGGSLRIDFLIELF